MRVANLTALAKANAAAGQPLDAAQADKLQAELAFAFQVDTKQYATSAVGDPVATSAALRTKYSPVFATCS